MKKAFQLFISFAVLFAVSSATQAQQTTSNWLIKYDAAKVFIENKGQFPVFNKDKIKTSDVLYAFDNGQTMIYFNKTGVTYVFNKKVTKKEEGRRNKKNHVEEENEERSYSLQTDMVSMNFEGANTNVEIVAEDQTPDYFSYSYNEAGSVKNINFIKGFRKITYKNIYPDIDIVYTFHPIDGIEYSIILHPGADISKVMMNFSNAKKIVISKNEVHISTLFGDIIEHAPIAFYSTDPSNAIVTNFNKTQKTISFAFSESIDNTKTIIIDPWVQTPVLPSSNCVWECECDSTGNVYIISGDSPMKLIKYDVSGAIQWTHSTPYDTANYWLGSFAVDAAGNSYISAGSIARLEKVNTNGGLRWALAPGGMSSEEYWDLDFTCDQSKLLIGGTAGSMTQLNGAIFQVDTSNGSLLNQRIIAGGNMFGMPPEIQEARSITTLPNNKCYFLTLDTIGCINQNLLSPPVYRINSTYNLSYKNENFRPNNGNSGIVAIKASSNFLYTQNALKVHKRSLQTGAILDSAAIPLGSHVVNSYNENQLKNCGIDIDDCGNVYIGSCGLVVKYDANLNLLSSVTVPFNVYDISVNNNGEVVACGGTGTMSSINRIGYVQSINMSACSPMAAISFCCDASIIPAGPFCTTDLPVNLIASNTGGTWSGPGITDAVNGTFNPSIAGAGTFSIVHTIGCGSDSLLLTVNVCPDTGLHVCQEPNGNITVSNGTQPYYWQYRVDTVDCSSCPLGLCMPPTCYGVPVVLWVTYASGTTVAPHGTDTIRVIDHHYKMLEINNPSAINICVVGILESENEKSDFYMFPNPANDILTIETLQKDAQMEILSIHGQRLLKQDLKQSKTEIDISSLAKGIYIVRVGNGEMAGVKKLVKD